MSSLSLEAIAAEAEWECNTFRKHYEMRRDRSPVRFKVRVLNPWERGV